MSTSSSRPKRKKPQADDSNVESQASSKTGSEAASKEDAPKKKTRLWFVLLGIATIVILIGWLGPKTIQNYSIYQAQLALTQRHYDDAEVWIDRGLSVSPNSGELTFLKARVQRKQGEFDQFKKTLVEAKRLGYSKERCRRETILAEAQSGKLSEAEEEIETLLDDSFQDSAEVAEAFVSGYLLTGRLSQARLLSDEWMIDYPDDPAPHLMFGMAASKFGQREQAIEAFRKALELQPDYYQAAMQLAITLDQERQFDEAIELFKMCAEVPSMRKEALINLGASYRRQGDLDQAIASLREAETLDPDDPDLMREMGRVEVLSNEFESAVEHLEAAMDGMYARNGEVRGLYAMALRGVGRADEAAEHAAYAEEAVRKRNEAADLARGIKEDDPALETRIKIGTLLLEFGSEQEGLIWLFSVLDLDPSYGPAHEVLAGYYSELAVKDPRFQQAADVHRAMAAQYARAQAQQQ